MDTSGSHTVTCMPPRTSLHTVSQPSISQDMALETLSTLLHAFEEFSAKPYPQVSAEEQEWQLTTEGIVIRAFGQHSAQHNNFARAKNAGISSLQMVAYGDYGHNDIEIAADKQQMFEHRIIAYRASVRAMVKELQLIAPRIEKTGVYDSGNPFSFYLDLSQLLRTATARILIVDAYLGREVFELYLEPIPSNIRISILTGARPLTSATLLNVAKLFRANRALFEIRESEFLHDRIVIIDDRCWAIGQSIKDAAHKKPTYMVEIISEDMRLSYNNLWLTSSSVEL